MLPRMRFSAWILAATLGLIASAGLGAASPAVALDNNPPNLIQQAPTAEQNGATASRVAEFQLLSPTYPGYNECRINYGPWKKCSWSASYSLSTNGDFLFQVRRIGPDGATVEMDDYWAWSVRSNADPIETLPQCAIPDEGATGRERVVFWRSTNTSSAPWDLVPLSTLVTLERQGVLPPSLFALMDDRPDATGQVGKIVPLSLKPRTIPSGGAVSYWIRVASPLLRDKPGAVLTTWSPGGYSKLRLSSSPAWQGLVDCVRVLPPAGISENADGTRSATFGWRNASPFTITAPTSGGSNTVVPATGVGTAEPNTLTGPAAATTGDPRPTVFPAYSSGTWTYTWTPSAADATATVTWQVGASTASFAPGAPARVTAGSTVSPFTHVNANTRVPAPPLLLGAPPKSPTATTTTTGGAVTRLTRLTITSVVTSPQSRTARPGQLVHFRSTIRNVGPVDAVNPRVCETIPAGMRFVSAPGRELKRGRQVCWTSARLAAGASVQGSMTLRVRANARAGRRTNTITVRAKNACTTKTRTTFTVRGATASRASREARAAESVATSRLDAAREASEAQAAADRAAVAIGSEYATLRVVTRVTRTARRDVDRGALLSIRATITNTSAVAARRLRVCERIPRGLHVVRAPYQGRTKARTICWTSPELTAGDKASGTTVLRVNRNAPTGTRRHRTTVSAVNACPVISQISLNVRP